MLFFAILCKGLEHPQVLVSMGGYGNKSSQILKGEIIVKLLRSQNLYIFLTAWGLVPLTVV